jgi:hypothetical protein
VSNKKGNIAKKKTTENIVEMNRLTTTVALGIRNIKISQVQMQGRKAPYGQKKEKKGF